MKSLWSVALIASAWLSPSLFAAEFKEAAFIHHELLRCRGSESSNLVGGHVSLFVELDQLTKRPNQKLELTGSVTGVNIKTDLAPQPTFLYLPVFSGVHTELVTDAESKVSTKSTWSYRGVDWTLEASESGEGKLTIRNDRGTIGQDKLACARLELRGNRR